MSQTTSDARKAQLRQWIAEGDDRHRDGLPMLDDDSQPLSMASSHRLLEMWREELGDEGVPPMDGEVESDFPTIWEQS